MRLIGEGRPLVLKRKESAIAHERVKAKYNVGFDHFIEEPEILQLKGLFGEDGEEINPEKKEVPTAEATEEKKAA